MKRLLLSLIVASALPGLEAARAAAQVVEAPAAASASSLNLGLAPLAAAPGAALPSLVPSAAPSASLPAAPALRPLPALNKTALGTLAAKAAPLAQAAASKGAAPESLRHDAAWERSSGRTSASVAVPAFAGLGSPRLGPSAVSPRAAAPGLGANPLQSLTREQKTTIGIVAGVVAAVGITIGAFWYHAAKKNEVWDASKSAAEVVQIQRAQDAKDESTLLDISQEAYARRQRMLDRIAQAQAGNKDRVDDKDHDPINKAEAYAAFDGLIGGRAALSHNAVSQDPAKRLGEQTLATWQGRINDEQAKAAARGFDGDLAVRLQEMSIEEGRETAAAGRIGGDFKTFKDKVPSLFGGNMSSQFDRADEALQSFKSGEIDAEDAVRAAADAAMRGRVDGRLYAANAEYQGHRDHRDRLGDLHDRVEPVLEQAQRVDKDLSDAIDHLHSRQLYLALAMQHEDDVETYTGSDGKTHTRHVDNSGTYKLLAATEASNAQASISSAKAGMAALRPLIEQLRRDKGIGEEGLGFALNSNTGSVSGNGGLGVWGDLFLPGFWSFIGSSFDESHVQNARSRFAPVLQGLQSVQNEVGVRKASESGWVDGRIQREVNDEMGRARPDLKADLAKVQAGRP